uniref:Uncharacterized protein n=1 Tax=Globodera rostochiensis TaxID=31243 RepID=A0A914H9H9_GLORO
MRTFFLFMGFVVPAILLLMTDASPAVDTTPVLTSENQWDSDACGTGLTLSKGLIAEYTGNNTGKHNSVEP